MTLSTYMSSALVCDCIATRSQRPPEELWSISGFDQAGRVPASLLGPQAVRAACTS